MVFAAAISAVKTGQLKKLAAIVFSKNGNHYFNHGNCGNGCSCPGNCFGARYVADNASFTTVLVTHRPT